MNECLYQHFGRQSCAISTTFCCQVEILVRADPWLSLSLLEVRIQDLLEPERLQFSTSFCGELWESFDLTRHLTSFPGLRNAGVQVKNFAFDVRINYHAFGRPVISVSRIEEVVCLLELNLCLDLDCRLPSVLWFGMLPGPHGRIQYFIVQHCCYTIFIWTL